MAFLKTTGFNFNDLSSALTETINLNGVSFSSQAKKWESAEQAKDVIDAIDKCENLEFLDLEGNTLGVDGAKAIGEALKKHPEFKRALLKDLFTGRMKTEIPPALRSLGEGMIFAGAQLTVLDCSDNALGPNGMVGLVDLLQSKVCYSLQELRLNNCGLGIGGATMLAKALNAGLKASIENNTPMRLKVFIAGRNRLENDGSKALAGFFGKIDSLERFEVPQNGIYYPGITALSESFKKNTEMRVLNLNDNTIGLKGAEALSFALDSMQRLEEINFGDCLLKTKGAEFIAEALHDRHEELRILNLSFNEIGPTGGIVIASACASKSQLESLCLNGNAFGEEGRTQITEILEGNGQGAVLDCLDEDDSDGEEEEEENDDDDSYEDEEEEYDDECEGETEEENDNRVVPQTQNLNLTQNGQEVESTENVDSIESFCNVKRPTEPQFNSVKEDDKVAAFRKYLTTFPENEYLTQIVFVVVKCSGIATKSKEALNVAIELYKDCFEYAKKTNQVARVYRFFLIQLGLLKAEDKTFKPVYDITSCRFALRQAIKSNVIPSEATDVFNVFLDQIN